MGLALLLAAVVAACSGAIGSPAATATDALGPTASPTTSPSRGLLTASPTVTTRSTPMPLHLTAPAFADRAAIPAHYTCSGADVSPALAWEGVPEGTATFALIMLDTDASDFVHWVASDIAGDRRGLDEGRPSGEQGRNSFGRTGYGGPCPPPGSGTHHYVFTLYALSRPLGLRGVPTAAQVRAAAAGAGVTLATARLTGTFRR